jgi:hypothetical protein
MRIVGIGYNGFPWGCSDDQLPWSRKAPSQLDTKYPYVCHAELNAIMNKNQQDLKACRMYVTLFPCNECAKLIIQARPQLQPPRAPSRGRRAAPPAPAAPRAPTRIGPRGRRGWPRSSSSPTAITTPCRCRRARARATPAAARARRPRDDPCQRCHRAVARLPSTAARCAQASRRMLEMAGVRFRQHSPASRRVLVDFEAAR